MNEFEAQIKVEADPKRPWKAIVAFVLSFVVALSASVAGKETLEGLDVNGWLLIVLGALGTAAGTYLTRNPLNAEAVR